MSQAHLAELRSALAARGWKVTQERIRGDENVQGSGTWKICRNSASLLIDFAGFGPLGEEIPLDESYACDVRNHAECSLYFRKVNRSRQLWEQDLSNFLECIDRLSTLA